MWLLPVSAFAQVDDTAVEVVDPLAVVNGYVVRYVEIERIKPEFIESIAELDAQAATEVFGDRGKGGAVVIQLIGRS